MKINRFQRTTLVQPIEFNGKTATECLCRFLDFNESTFSIMFFDSNNDIVTISNYIHVVLFDLYEQKKDVPKTLKEIVDKALDSDFWRDKKCPLSDSDKEACRTVFYKKIEVECNE